MAGLSDDHTLHNDDDEWNYDDAHDCEDVEWEEEDWLDIDEVDRVPDTCMKCGESGMSWDEIRHGWRCWLDDKLPGWVGAILGIALGGVLGLRPVLVKNEHLSFGTWLIVLAALLVLAVLSIWLVAALSTWNLLTIAEAEDRTLEFLRDAKRRGVPLHDDALHTLRWLERKATGE